MLYVVMAFLWASILLYVIMGGADFGAGILEFFSTPNSKPKTQKILYEAIGPVWEANHMWLIIAIVILFVGFPSIYTTMSIYMHIPLAIMLIGIIARGTAFTFRHYDAVHDSMQRVYSKIFMYASVLTPFFLGIIAGGAVAGTIDTSANSYVSAYIFSWLGFFPVSVGFFTIAICGFMAAIFIIGETDNAGDKKRFTDKAKHFIIGALVLAVVVFIAAMVDGVPLSHWLFGNPISIACMSLAGVSLIWLWILLSRESTGPLRTIAGAQVTLLLVAITYEHYPVLINLKNAKGLSLIDAQGGPKTIMSLGIALLAGSGFILPFLYYLLYSFTNYERE